jgi:hypothetical protein
LLFLLKRIATLTANEQLPFHIQTEQILPFYAMLHSKIVGILLYEPGGSSIGAPLTPDIIRLRTSSNPATSTSVTSRDFLMNGFDGWHAMEVLHSEIVQSSVVYHAASETPWDIGKDDAEKERRAREIMQHPWIPSPAPEFKLGMSSGSKAEEYHLDAVQRLVEFSNASLTPAIKFVKVVEGAWHFGMVTHSQKFASMIEDFILSLRL